MLYVKLERQLPINSTHFSLFIKKKPYLKGYVSYIVCQTPEIYIYTHTFICIHNYYILMANNYDKNKINTKQ